MSDEKPIVYIFHGEDEFQIAHEVAKLEVRLGDPATASLNTIRLDGSVFQMDQLLTVAGAMPFLASRRLVILANPPVRQKEKPAQEKFLRQLEQIPPSTALILVENQALTSDQDHKHHKINFLEVWAGQNPQKVFIKKYELPRGAEWRKKIQEMAKEAGGQMSPQAAELLYSLLDGDVRLAHQEVAKLLAYVNYLRPVEAEDVAALTADVGQGDIFALVDAIGLRDGRKALAMLKRLLEYQDYYSIFGMVVRQFRLLVQVREILDEGGGIGEIMNFIKSKFIAEKVISQARHFTLSDLKLIYRQLLNVDETVKTSKMPDELALETLIVSLAA